MRTKKVKIMSMIMAAILMLQSVGMNVAAASNNVVSDVVPITSSDEMVVDDIGSDDGADIIPVVQDTKEILFPGLPESYELSAEQMEQKRILSEHTGEIAAGNMSADSDAYVKGEVLYLTDSEEEAQIVADAYGATLDSFAWGVAVICLPEDRTVVEATMAAADESTLLPAVWPNYYKEFHGLPNDPGLYDYYDEYSARYQWMHKYVGSATAWDAGYTGAGIKVAVLDSGIMNNHEEFEGRIAQHFNMLGDTPIEATTDITGHGTHVSGIIAANMNNAKGGAGIAPEASLYVYGISDNKGEISSDAEFRAINKAIAEGVDIINMSFGSAGYSEFENTVVQKAYDAGIAMFISAGNDTAQAYSYPASLDNVCSVAAIQEDGRKSYFSNYNDAVDLAFPGTDMWSAGIESTSAYEYMSGTSMAAPVAAGVAAVILSGAEKIPELAGKSGKERVDALYQVMQDNAQKSISAGMGEGTTYLPDVFNLTVGGRDVTPAAPTFNYPTKMNFISEYAVVVMTSATKEGVSIYYNADGKTPTFKNGVVTNGTLFSSDYILVGNKKSVTIKAIAVNRVTGKSSKVSTVKYTFSPEPTNVLISNANQTTRLTPGSKMTLNAQVRPAYSAPCKLQWEVSPADQGVTVSASGKVSVSKDATVGDYRISATALDSKGNAYTYFDQPIKGVYWIEVIEQAKKVKSLKIGKKAVTLYNGEVVNLGTTVTVNYTDKSSANGSMADVVWTSSNEDVATVTEGGLVKAVTSGKAVMRGTVNDGSNKSVTCKITVKQSAGGISVESDAANLAAGKSVVFKATVYPENASSKNVTWTVEPMEPSCTGKVKIKNGKVTASKDAGGKYLVTATTADGSGYSASRELVVVKDSVKSISMMKKLSIYVPAEESKGRAGYFLDAEIVGNPGACLYESSNPNVATVDAKTGEVSAVASGKAVITCRATDGSKKEAKCTVTVNVPVSRINIVPGDENNGVVYVGSSIKMDAVVGYSYGKSQDAKINWRVADSDKDIISVSKNGVVKAKSLGRYKDLGSTSASATIYAETEDGYIGDSYTIIVYNKLKEMEIAPIEDKYTLWGTDVDGVRDSVLFYDIQVKAPKGYSMGVQRELFGEFLLVPDKPTTDKITDITKEDGIKVTVTAKPHGYKKKVSKVFYVARTINENVYMFE